MGSRRLGVVRWWKGRGAMTRARFGWRTWVSSAVQAMELIRGLPNPSASHNCVAYGVRALGAWRVAGGLSEGKGRTTNVHACCTKPGDRLPWTNAGQIAAAPTLTSSHVDSAGDGRPSGMPVCCSPGGQPAAHQAWRARYGGLGPGMTMGLIRGAVAPGRTTQPHRGPGD